MRPLRLALAGALVLLALLLPVPSLASALMGSGAPLHRQVMTGVWIFKGMLVVHAALVLLLARLRPPHGADALIAGRFTPPASRSERTILLAMLTVAAALRLYDLGNGLWFDEIQTLVSYVRLPFGRIIATFDSQNQHMLYSVLARLSILAFGESAWALRLPAALLGVASLAALYWFGCQVTGRREALLATSLLVVSYHHVWFSQNARGYTGLMLWGLVGSGLFLRLASTPRPHGWGVAAGYGAIMALAAYTHATALLILAAHFLIWAALAVRARRRGNGRAAVVPLVAFVLAGSFTLQLHALVLPQFVATLLLPTAEVVGTSWEDPLWFLSESMSVLAAGVPGGLPAVVLGALAAGAGVYSYIRRNPAVAAIMLLPVLVTSAVLQALEHNLWPRLFFFAAGFGVLIAVRGSLALGAALFGSRGSKLAAAALVVAGIASAFTVPTAYQPKQDFHGARAFIGRSSTPDDAVVTVDMSGYVYDFLAPDWLSVRNTRELAEVEARHARTWLVYTFPLRLSAVYPDIWSRIDSSYTTAATFPGTVGGGTIVVKVNRSMRGVRKRPDLHAQHTAGADGNEQPDR